MDLSYILTMLLLFNTSEVELSVWTSVFVWGQPILMRVFWMGNIDLDVMKRPVSSASESEDMKNLIIWSMVRMDTLSRGTG